MFYKIKTRVLKQCMIPSVDKDGKVSYDVIRLVYCMEGDERYFVDFWICDPERDSVFSFYDSDDFDNDLSAESAFDYLVRNRLFMSHCPEHDGNDIKTDLKDFLS